MTNPKGQIPSQKLTATPDIFASSFGQFVAESARIGLLVVQPRMGFSDPRQMRDGLWSTRSASAHTVGTITVDSYSRVGDYAAARRAMDRGLPLNGYPIATHSVSVTRELLDGVKDHSFPIQVRHGSAQPLQIIEAMLECGIYATEGGPVSYCLPYGRIPLYQSVDNWSRTCELLAMSQQYNEVPHLETFGGCMLGQLCPPALLIAISVLEALFFVENGIRSVSLSYSQQTNTEQDQEALAALNRLACELLGAASDWHIVVYAYMGLYPQTVRGARDLLRSAAELASSSAAARLIVKTDAEAFRIPTIKENIAALELAGNIEKKTELRAVADTGIYAEAAMLVDAVLELSQDVGLALRKAFQLGILDVPYCLHPDNASQTRCYLDAAGRLVWSDLGSMPTRSVAQFLRRGSLSASELMEALSYVRRKFDQPMAVANASAEVHVNVGH